MLATLLSSLERWGWESGLERYAAGPGPDGALLSWARQKSAPLPSEVPPLLQTHERFPELVAWLQTNQALAAMRSHDFGGAHALLDLAVAAVPAGDGALRGTIAHLRGALLLHETQPEAALVQLHVALEQFGKDHFVTGRILDTLGMVYAGKDNYPTARELYLQALLCKERFGDEPGLALSHGQLGRLALDWGDWQEAENHFQLDLQMAERLGDARGVAQLHNHLGQVALARGDLEKAVLHLEESIRRSRDGGWRGTEGYARKDRALVALAKSDVGAAEQQLAEAERLFQGFREGIAHVERARGQLFQAQGLPEKAAQAIACALSHFVSAGEKVEVARTQWQRAQLLRSGGAALPIVVKAFEEALDSAESCRRHALVRAIEGELRHVDEVVYWRRVYHRARGREVLETTVSLLDGTRESATVLFLDLQGSTAYMNATDPDVVMVTFNQMMADLADLLNRHGLHVTAYLGDGFMALVRGQNHARRGVAAALEVTRVLREFNRPRAVLGLPPFHARLGLSTGEIVLGNVGTYNKMDFTALGTTVNLAARLQSEAEVGKPCISAGTYEAVKDVTVFQEGSPRTVYLKGLGERQAWDVVGSLEV